MCIHKTQGYICENLRGFGFVEQRIEPLYFTFIHVLYTTLNNNTHNEALRVTAANELVSCLNGLTIFMGTPHNVLVEI